MISFVFGTTGEVIKLAPVMLELNRRGLPYLAISTGQQEHALPGALDLFGLRQPDVNLGPGRGRDLEHMREVPRWFGAVARNFRRARFDLRARHTPGPSVAVVHGDTMTTVLGALMGRALRLPVAHVEAGMRSHDLLHPFPEEFNRRATARLARFHFAPGPTAVANLTGVPGEVVDTGHNTTVDSLDLMCRAGQPAGMDVPERFGLVSLHRFELLSDAPEFEATLHLLAEAAPAHTLVFVDHPQTAKRVNELHCGHVFDGRSFVRLPKVPYDRFVKVLQRADFVVTDSGGLQEECAYLDIPCLVHRRRTERMEGAGVSFVLSEFDHGLVRKFLADPRAWRTGHRPSWTSPSALIVDRLAPFAAR